MRTTRARTAYLAGLAVTLITLGGLVPSASAAPYACEASALRAVVLGQAVEPVVANRGKACATVKQGGTNVVPVIVDASALSAATTLTGPDGPQREQAAVASGGITALRVAGLPDLGLGPVLEQILAPVRAAVAALPDALEVATPAVTVDNPLGGPPIVITPAQTVASVNVKQAATDVLDALAKLPATELLGLAAATSTVGAKCANGVSVPQGGSRVAGLKVLGQEIPTDAASERTIQILDTGSIDLATLFTQDGVLGRYVTLGVGVDLSVVGPLLAPLLAAIPPIAIPGEVLKVKVTPSTQERTGGTLTQRALRVELAALGRSILDLVVGEAKVGAIGVDCTVPPPAGGVLPETVEDQLLGCTARALVLVDVVPSGKRVDLFGAADKKLVGRTVGIVFEATRKQVASAVVQPDGSFRTTAPMPSRRLARSDRARYKAVLGKERSLNLKLQRRMRVTGIQASRGKVTIRGRVTLPLARPIDTITLSRRLSCKTSETVARFKPASDGTFRVTVDAPDDATAAVYRLKTTVRRTVRNPKRFQTFTLPRGVNLLG